MPKPTLGTTQNIPTNQKMKYSIIILTLFFSFSSTKAQQTVSGKMVNAVYASSDEDYFFCEDGTVMFRANVSEERPLILYGTWSESNGKVYTKFHTKIAGKGIGKPSMCASVCVYDKYELYTKTYSSEGETLYHDEIFKENCAECDMYTAKEFNTKCGNIPEYYTPNKKLDGKYPQTSLRPLLKSELNGLSKWELKIMRNEIFARHGYIFKTEKMKNYFKKQGWHYGGIHDNVDLLLTPIEKENIKLIKQYENL